MHDASHALLVIKVNYQVLSDPNNNNNKNSVRVCVCLSGYFLENRTLHPHICGIMKIYGVRVA